MNDPNVEVVVGEIQDEVRRKYEAGEYPPEIAAELVDSYGRRHLAGRLDQEMRELREFHFSGDIEAASQKALVRPFIAGGKRAVRGGLRWYTNALLGQMERFALRVSSTIASLGARVEQINERVDVVQRESIDARSETSELRDALHRVREHADTLQSRLDSLETTVDDAHRDRIPRLERAVRELNIETTPHADAPAAVPPSFEVERQLDYLGFEHRFRGPVEAVAENQRWYVPRFRDLPGRVVDIGCGRGEFLSLLAEEGVDSYGIDRYRDMVLHCRELGLDVVEAEALEHLASVEEGSLGGISAMQVIEHFVPVDIVRFFELAARALHADGLLVVETVNPESLYVFTHALYLDLGHSKPLHPKLLAFLADRAGFKDVRTEYRSLPQDSERPLPMPETTNEELKDLSERIEENFKRVDQIVFGPQDFAIVARR